MSRVLLVCLLLATAAPAWAGPGDPVVGLRVGVDRTIVGVSWEGSEEDSNHQGEGAMLGGFTLFASYSPGGAVIARMALPWPPPPSGEEGGSSPSFFVPGVPDGRYYVVVVRGLVNTVSVSASAWAEVVVNVATCGSAPAAPVHLLGAGPTPAGTLLTALSWLDGPGGCPPAMWEIVVGSEPGAANVGSLRAAGRNFATIAPPGTYYVRVHALNAFGRSGPSNEIALVVHPITCLPPAAPQNVTMNVVANQVTLSWNAPSPGSFPIAFYHIAAGSMPALSNVANIRVPASATSFSTAAPPGRYYVRVYAGNGCGGAFEVGLPSNEVIVNVQ